MGALSVLAAVVVSAHLSVTPTTAGVGTRVTAQAVVTVDSKVVDPATVRVAFGVAPLAALGPVQRNGLRFSVTAACLDEGCVPDATSRTVRLVPFRVTGHLRDGSTFNRTFRWPAIVLAPQVPASALRGSPKLRLETTAPPPDYAVAPRTLAAALDAAAAVLALALAAAVVILRRRVLRRRAAAGGPAARAQSACARARRSPRRPRRAGGRARVVTASALLGGGRRTR
ncbi:MAG TPA: hypothetical protein VLE97_03965 [Gaiellaceae bacterium]|nr:hypothetical protein [Gaiellaceae bacterium]